MALHVHVGTSNTLLLIWWLHIYIINIYRHKASIYLNFLIIFLKNIVTLNNLEIKIRYNCCDFSLNSPQLIPFT